MGREVRRVPLDFDWKLNETWIGFFNPFWEHHRECEECDGSGSSPEAKRFRDQWYGTADFDPVAYGAAPLRIDNPAILAFATRNVDRNPDFFDVHAYGREDAIRYEAERLFGNWKNQWCHHLIQADVDALVAEGRLIDFTHSWSAETRWQPVEPAPIVTAEQVNAWSLAGMGHDSINQWVCVKARCEREGVAQRCNLCNGEGCTWPTKAHKALYEAWQPMPPPEGEGWQVWETVSEGSPISPVFETSEAMVDWLAGEGYSREAAEAFAGRGWAPSLVSVARDGKVEVYSDIESAGKL